MRVRVRVCAVLGVVGIEVVGGVELCGVVCCIVWCGVGCGVMCGALWCGRARGGAYGVLFFF